MHSRRSLLSFIAAIPGLAFFGPAEKLHKEVAHQKLSRLFTAIIQEASEHPGFEIRSVDDPLKRRIGYTCIRPDGIETWHYIRLTDLSLSLKGDLDLRYNVSVRDYIKTSDGRRQLAMGLTNQAHLKAMRFHGLRIDPEYLQSLVPSSV